MVQAIPTDRELTLQLYHVLSEIDPVRWRDSMAAAARSKVAEITSKMEARLELLAQSAETLKPELRHRLTELTRQLRAQLPSPEVPTCELKGRWLEFKKSVQPSYEALAVSFRREQIHVPSLRPTNLPRSLMHIGSAAAGVTVIELFGAGKTTLVIAGLWALSAWSMEIGRRLNPKMNEFLMRTFAKVAHPHERHRVNSATWYATALVLLALTQTSWLCLVALTVLGLGDPAAGFFGRRFGRIRIAHRRTLEGSLGFVGVSSGMSLVFLSLFHPEIAPGIAITVSLSAALVGAVTEVFSTRVDDNFSIPLAAAVAAGCTGWLLGLSVGLG